jgi:hypothetical protein
MTLLELVTYNYYLHPPCWKTIDSRLRIFYNAAVSTIPLAPEKENRTVQARYKHGTKTL